MQETTVANGHGEPTNGRADLPRVTVVDDNDEFISLLADIFDGRYQVTAAGRASIAAIAETRPQVVILDLHSDDGERPAAWDLVSDARQHAALDNVPVVLCTGDVIALSAYESRLDEFGDVHLLAKPFALENIEGLLKRLIPEPAPASR
jgi:CheY-like chemotaxis protein